MKVDCYSGPPTLAGEQDNSEGHQGILLLCQFRAPNLLFPSKQIGG